MIEVKNVSKIYKETKVVDQVNFNVHEAEIFGLLGPNGAGKTTTIRMMIGLLKPSEGEIWVDNLNIQRDTKQIHNRIGVVFEIPNLYAKWSVRDNLKFFADLYKVPLGQINNVMERLHLQDRAEMKVQSLSKGWKQRVLIARALLHQPKILFLDEPTSGLDPNTATLIRQYIRTLKSEGTTIVMTTHDMHEADELSDRVGIMHQGVLVALDSPQMLKKHHGENNITIEYDHENEVKKKTLPLNRQDTASFLYETMNAWIFLSNLRYGFL